MTSTNRVRLSSVKEVTYGVTPGSPRMRSVRYTSDSLKAVPDYQDSNEIRSDRMNYDPIPTIKNSGGGINGEFSYPVQDYPLSVDIESAMYNTWTNTPTRDNDGVADSVITDISATVATVTTGAAFALGHLVLFSGFGVVGNNGIKRCTTGSATVPGFAAGIAIEAVPPAAARMKVVGFSGVAGDITATATGLAATTLNFTTLGLVIGQWVKIGGTAAGDQFATAANNTFARITAIAATALTLDNLPSGWAVDAGAAKTIKVWYGDFIKNGTTRVSQTIEKGFMAQVTPTYLTYLGQVVDTFELTLTRRAIVTHNKTYKGASSAVGTVSLDAIPDPEPINKVMAAHAHVGRIGEAGVSITGPNWMSEFSVNINNNLRYIEAVDSASPVDIQPGECTVTGKADTYFGDPAIYTKFLNGTATALNARTAREGQAVIWDIPRATYREGGDTAVSGKNSDVMLSVGYQASVDPTFLAHVMCNRLEYIEPPTAV